MSSFNEAFKNISKITVVIFVSMALSGCYITGSSYITEQNEVLSGKKALIYFRVYEHGIIFKDWITNGTVSFTNTSPQAESFKDRTLYFSLGTDVIYPGEYALDEIIMEAVRLTQKTGAPFATFEAKGGEVLYLGTFEARPAGYWDMEVVDRSDINEARKAVAVNYPQLAPLLKPRIFKGPSIKKLDK